jgi:hypothetical protein
MVIAVGYRLRVWAAEKFCDSNEQFDFAPPAAFDRSSVLARLSAKKWPPTESGTKIAD